ncbi:MAG TPA: Plug domain-containing protein, partial [Pelovirga sp.]|nr:Plug domain-containing protein [Pelovirga sp.]
MKIFLLMIALFYSLPLWAEDLLPAPEDVPLETTTSLHTLKPVIVHATSIESGKTTIGGTELEMLPSATGSITEALKGMSQIQFDYERQSSLTVGEIAPPRISISGAKPYENNFMIDGMSVTNTINPSGFDNRAGWNSLDVGGGDASIFYDTDLIKSISVHSSNVPARYGGFVGGVVDAQLRDPATDRWQF